MKNLFILSISVLLCFSAFAQGGPRGLSVAVPQNINYQAVVRNANGAVVANSPVGIRVSILEKFTNNVEYTELHYDTTNQFGLISIKIGNGTVVSGTFTAIPWTLGQQQVKVEVDPTGGTSYTVTGLQDLSSVPTALVAKEATDNVKKTGDVMTGNLSFAAVAVGSTDIGVGHFNHDNAPLAWGFVNLNGGISATNVYNVASAVKNSTGNYTVTLSSGASAALNLLVPVANAEIDAPITSAATNRILAVNITSITTFDVYITDGNYTPVDNDFTFVVFGK